MNSNQPGGAAVNTGNNVSDDSGKTSELAPAMLADARAVAAALIDAGCVTMRTDEPFRLPSGWASPAYMDCRRLISFPSLRRGLVSAGLSRLEAFGALQGLDAVVGAEASGIALAAWIADALELPLLYVRKKAAGQSQVEGAVKRGDKALLVDDLIAAGHSKLRFLQALAAAGVQVADVFVVFDYGTFDHQESLASMNVRLHSLATWRDVLAVARERQPARAADASMRDGLWTDKALQELEDFVGDPSAWSQAHGGIGGQAPRPQREPT